VSAASARRRSRAVRKNVVVDPAVEGGAADVGEPGTLDHSGRGNQVWKGRELAFGETSRVL